MKKGTAKPAAKKEQQRPVKQSKVISLGASKPAQPEKPKVLIAPTGTQQVKVTLKKEMTEGLGINLDAYYNGDDFVLVLDDVAPEGAGKRHGLEPLIGSRIFMYEDSFVNRYAFFGFVRDGKNGRNFGKKIEKKKKKNFFSHFSERSM